VTPILFLIGYGLGLVLTFVRHPIYGLYTYLFAFYMAPSYTWWRNDVPDIRYLFIAGIVAVIGTLRLADDHDPQRLKWHQTTPGRLFLLFVCYNWLQVFWAIAPDAQIDAAFLYTKHLVSFYLMYRFADSIDRIKEIALIHVVGCAWFGYQALDASGGRLESIGGAVAGANELGVHVSTGLLFGGILLLGFRGIRRWLTFACLPLIANCLVLTISRGAFLGVLAGGLAGYFTIPKRLTKLYALCGILALVLVSMLAHEALVERFTETYLAMTTEQGELDRSAASRMEIARAGLAIGLDHPFGAGDSATEILSGQYLTPFEKGRAAHNTTMAVFAEHGVPGLILYLLTILWVVRSMLRMRRAVGTIEPESEQNGALMTLAGTSLLAVYVSGNFSSNLGLETQYWCLALLASTVELQKTLQREAFATPSPLNDTVQIEAGRDDQSAYASASESPSVKNQFSDSRKS